MTRYITWGVLGLIGAGAFVLALGFRTGARGQIGSAELPLVLSGGLVLVALWGLATARAEESFPPQWRPLAAVTAAVAGFALLVEPFGLVPATLVSMTLAYLGQRATDWGLFALYTAGFAAALWLIFIVGLGLPVGAFGGR